MKNKFSLIALSSLLVITSLSVGAHASVALAPGAVSVALPGTAALAEGDLTGVVVEDNVIPFRIMSPAGALLFEGKLQNRVVRSNTTNLLHFYYRIRDTKPGLNGIIKSIWTRPFDASIRILADWRPDGLGMVNPIAGSRSPGDGQLIRFDFNTAANVLVGGRDSRFFYLKTYVKNYNKFGQTRIMLTTGDATVVNTFAPVK